MQWALWFFGQNELPLSPIVIALSYTDLPAVTLWQAGNHKPARPFRRGFTEVFLVKITHLQFSLHLSISPYLIIKFTLFYSSDDSRCCGYSHRMIKLINRPIVPSFHRSIVPAFHHSVSFHRSIIPAFRIVHSLYHSIYKH